MALSPSARLGPYEIVAAIGSGGMGEVYRARDTRLKREVALKILTGAPTEDSGRFKRFQTEAESTAALSHPHIVAVYDVGQEGGTPYIVSELVSGGTLTSLLNRGPLSTKKLLDLGIPVAEALATAHAAGIVHRDLKPDNILITTGGSPKIADFGLAKFFLPAYDADGSRLTTLADEQTKEGSILGTVGYMSPEQAKGEPVDYRSDQFAFGSILYEMATGKRAFQKSSAVQTLAAIVQEEPATIAALNPKVPAPLRWIIERCLAKEPKGRYTSTEDLARELAGVRQHASEIGLSEGMPRARPRGARAIGMIAAVGATALACVAIGVFVGRRIEGTSPALFQRLTFRRGNIGQARFAPDGQTVVYGASWENQPVEVFTTRLDSPESRSLGIIDLGLYSVSSLGEIAGYWLPERKGDDWLLARMPLTGGTPRALLKDAGPADWSPDGTQLAIVHRVGSSPHLEFPIGKVLYEGTSIWYMRVSPQGDRVAFDDHPFGGSSGATIKVADSSGKTKPILKDVAVTGLAWSPSGREIWFSGGPRDALYSLTLDGKMRLLHQSAGRLYLTDVFRDGRALVRQDNWRMGIIGRYAGEAGEGELSWMANSLLRDASADLRTLLFYDGGKGEGWEGPGGFSGVYLRKVGEPAVRLGRGEPIALSPDGKWALSTVDGHSQLVLLPTGAGESRPLTKENLIYDGWGRFLPDGKRIVFGAHEPGRAGRCWVQSVGKGDRRPITPEDSDDFLLTADGRFVAAGPAGKELLYPVQGGQPRGIPFLSPGEMGDHDTEFRSLLQWSADGRYLYLRTDTVKGVRPIQISRLDLSTGRRDAWMEISPADRSGLTVTGIQLSADGKSYVYAYSRRLSDLYLVEGLK